MEEQQIQSIFYVVRLRQWTPQTCLYAERTWHKIIVFVRKFCGGARNNKPK